MAFADTKTVTQVTTAVTLQGKTDYVITSATPITSTGSIAMSAGDEAVVIFKKVKPSLAANYLQYITIDGATAVNGTNCQLKVYNQGSIIMPMNATDAPCILYTGTDLSGMKLPLSVSDKMNALGPLYNNRVQSVFLHRGYMLCLANYADGTGYSRIFIADTGNRTINLPAALSGKVSSARVMVWNDVNKKGYAGSSTTVNDKLNTTWCYNWDNGNYSWPNREFVTQHHHEGWPSIESCGTNGSSPNLLGNNEPDNTADAKEQDVSVDEVLKTWPQMMATGKRLGSPAMASNLTWLYSFIDSIDKRGWRCDFVALHCYWYQDWSDWQTTLKAIHDRTGRPIWITEMNYGANWTGWPGSNTNGTAANYAIEKKHMAPIVDGLESTDYIERYAIYNAVQDCRRVWDGSKLTPMGEYYAAKSSRLAFNSSYGVTPRTPDMKSPDRLAVNFNPADSTTTLTWHEYNGEWNRSMTIEKLVNGSWVTVDTIAQKEPEADYTYTVKGLPRGTTLRVHVVTLNGVNRYTAELASTLSTTEPGTPVVYNGATWYMGGNILWNGDFSYGMDSWTNGTGSAPGQPDFQVVPFGGPDGSAYLQAWTHGGATSTASLHNSADVQANTPYYFGVTTKNNSGSWQKLSLSKNGTSEDQTVLNLQPTDTWNRQETVFSTGSYTHLALSYRWLGAKAAYDKFCLARLYPTLEEALADAAQQPKPNRTTDAVNDSVNQMEQWRNYADSVAQLGLPGSDTLVACVYNLDNAEAMQQAIHNYLQSQPEANFASNNFSSATTPWVTKAGTYTGGDQSATRQLGVPCWNAWWSGIDAAQLSARTMAIYQQRRITETGFYRLEAKATTQHYCLSDQHAYIQNVTSGAAQNSPALQAQWLDVPDVTADEAWQRLTTLPVYVGERDSLRIGFMSSKQGAIDNAWRKYADESSTGDKREGWWCAADFKVTFTPAYQAEVTAGDWQTICLPYDAQPGTGVEVYTVAGLDSAGTHICLEPVTVMQAGMPYVYRATGSKAVFLESGKKVGLPVTGGHNGLLGVFHAVKGSVSDVAYVLVNNAWVPAKPADTDMGWNHAYLGAQSLIPFVDASAYRMQLPISGTTSGIATARNAATKSESVKWYNLSGQRVNVNRTGVYINNHKKVIVKP